MGGERKKMWCRRWWWRWRWGPLKAWEVLFFVLRSPLWNRQQARAGRDTCWLGADSRLSFSGVYGLWDDSVALTSFAARERSNFSLSRMRLNQFLGLSGLLLRLFVMEAAIVCDAWDEELLTLVAFWVVTSCFKRRV